MLTTGTGRFGLAASMDFINVEDFMGQAVTAEVL